MHKKFLRHYLWTRINALAAKQFKRAMLEPRETQEKILMDFLQRNQHTQFGKKYGYASIKSITEFRERLPKRYYEDFEKNIEAIKKGQSNVLSTDKTLFFETSSGSSGPVKYIPYNQKFLSEFRKSISTWMYDLFMNRPELMKGSQYWSISPMLRTNQFTEGNIPIGITDDSEYLGKFSQRLIGPNLAMSSAVVTNSSLADWQKNSIQQLTACRDLRFISVWSPSFLISLIQYLPEGMSPQDFWPDLKIISCWGDAAAKRFIPELKTLFPGIEIQFKGLMATEGVISIPLFEQPDPVIALTSHFLEFVDDNDRCYLVDELTVGNQYKVLLTSGNGLVRYALGDVIEVTAPLCIKFVGRGDTVSDLCGEKLSESFVQRVFDKYLPDDSFFLLVPQWGETPCYYLYHQCVHDSELASKIDEALRESFHYNYCRQLGQLAPVQSRYCPDLAVRYYSACVAAGQRPGDVKPRALLHSIDLAERIFHEI
ncbi:GH3 auxin-responsive promoter [Legionella santicrucis]|uniref:GH3 auxin-responsive promoter n=1 Tax=Legionella santicrucis TaxID=45074 RepID=A0A0W0YKC1_9GAMM|nr:GH3 auxin-responsive promoter family protein [Legionella santicrucis]KTD57014.1 GH3 auxin-responsive promoter [Legionella santicrucis]